MPAPAPTIRRLVVVGVGLIGGSIGKAARERGVAGEVVGLVRSEESAERARAAGVVDTVTTDPAEAAAGADLVVLCTPVGSIVSSLETLLPHLPAEAIVTDAGSTKERIVREAGELLATQESVVRFVGSHPMAGDHRTGPEAARGDLFEHRHVVVTLDEKTTDEAACGVVGEFWRSLGAEVGVVSSQSHDMLVASSSHVPHLVASVLAASTPEEALPLTATGWRDTTRVAAGATDLWIDIFRDNREQVLLSLNNFADHLRKVTDALESNDWPTVGEILAEGKQRRDAVKELPANNADKHE